MWKDLWPERAVADVPIGHVTNGVHIPTWLGGPMRELLDRHLGEGWLDRAADPATWAPGDDIPDEELGAGRSRQRADLVDWVRGQSLLERLGHDEPGSPLRAGGPPGAPPARTAPAPPAGARTAQDGGAAGGNPPPCARPPFPPGPRAPPAPPLSRAGL